MKRDTASSASSTSDSGAPRESKPTTARVQHAKYQSGEKEGQESKNRLFVFNPRYGLNERATSAVTEHAYPKDTVSSFNKELGGFYIHARVPAQAKRMYSALRALDDAMPEKLDVGDWQDPEATLVTMKNVDLPATKTSGAIEGATAVVVESEYTYPLYKKLRALGCDFVRGIHGKAGVNKWVRVVGAKDDANKIEKAVGDMLKDEGWAVEFAAPADAADWESDEE